MKGKKLFLICLLALLSVSIFAKVNGDILKKAMAKVPSASLAKNKLGKIPAVTARISKPADLTTVPGGISTAPGSTAPVPGNDCVNVATAVATNVAFAQSDLGNAQAVATTMAKAGDVTAISNVVASITSVNKSLAKARAFAIAISTSVAIQINLCPQLKGMLQMMSIELETAIASTMGVAIATNNPEDLQMLGSSLSSAADNLRDSIKLFK